MKQYYNSLNESQTAGYINQTEIEELNKENQVKKYFNNLKEKNNEDWKEFNGLNLLANPYLI